MRILDNDLEESPFAEPDSALKSLSGIRLPHADHKQIGWSLHAEITRQQKSAPVAAIALSRRTGAPDDVCVYQFRPDYNIWEQWIPGQTEPNGLFENQDFVGHLESRVNVGGALEGLYDLIPSGMEIAYMLMAYFQGSARTKKQERRYSSNSILFENNTDYTAGVKSEFRTQRTNGRTARELTIESSYLVGLDVITKRYLYKTRDRGNKIQSGEGNIVIESSGPTPIARLDAFAGRDLEQPNALRSLHASIGNLRQSRLI